MSGKVYLLGAGPGNPELLTLLARDILTRSEVVLYDYLANIELLDELCPEAEKIYVGKKSGRSHPTQEEINKMLLDFSQQGKTVVRFKGGDPLIFGRGGEEACFLREHKIPFEIIPGISSATAVPTCHGIPLTHRGISSSFTVVTGNEDPAKSQSSINWKAIAQTGGTIVILMGIKKVKTIVDVLLSNGLPADTPAAVISWGTLNSAKSIVTTVSGLVDRVNETGIRPPGIIIIGQTVTLRDQLEWFESRPLFGKTVVLTRPEKRGRRLKSRLRELGANVVSLPMIRFVRTFPEEGGLSSLIDSPPQSCTLCFTSRTAVEFLRDDLTRAGKDSRWFSNNLVAAVGKSTAESLREHFSIVADIVPERPTGLELARKLLSLPKSPVYLFRAERGDKSLVEKFRESGRKITVVTLYRTIPAEGFSVLEKPISPGKNTIVLFHSPSAVAAWCNVPENTEFLKKSRIVSAGPITRNSLLEQGLQNVEMTDSPDTEGVILYLSQNS